MEIKYCLMVLKTKIKDKVMNHPYKQFEKTEQWKIIEQVIKELIENGDLELYTPIEYVIGTICKELSFGGFNF